MTARAWLLPALPVLLAGCPDDASTQPRHALGQASADPEAGTVDWDDGTPGTPDENVENHTQGPLSPPVTPSDTVRRVNKLRRAGRLAEMAEFVAQDRRDAVLELVAVSSQR